MERKWDNENSVWERKKTNKNERVELTIVVNTSLQHPISPNVGLNRIRNYAYDGS